MTNEELIEELKKLNPKSNVYSYTPIEEGEEEFKCVLIIKPVEMDNKDKDIVLLPYCEVLLKKIRESEEFVPIH